MKWLNVKLSKNLAHEFYTMLKTAGIDANEPFEGYKCYIVSFKPVGKEQSKLAKILSEFFIEKYIDEPIT